MKFARMPMLLKLIAFSMVTFTRLEVTAQEAQNKESSTTTFNFSLTVDGKSLKVDAKLETTTSPALLKPSQEVTDDKLVETYYVADLIVPINEARKVSLYETGEFEISDQERAAITAKDFDPIINLIKSTIDSESWEGRQAGSISPYPVNLSLVIAQTQSSHRKIQSLLQKLRELNDVMIKLDSHLVIVNESSSLSGESFDATSIKNFKRMVQVVADNAVISSNFPAAVLFNGEPNTYRPSSETDSQLAPLYLQAVVTPDRKSVKLLCTNQEPPTAKGSVPTPAVAEKPKEETKQKVAATVSKVVQIANKGYVSIDVTPMLENNSENHKAILFVRPTISDKGKK